MITRGGAGKPKNAKRSKKKEILVQRVSAEICLDSTKAVTNARVFLSDLSPESVNCFMENGIPKGAVVSVVLAEPKHLYVKGQIAFCTPYSLDTKVISAEAPFKYRAGIRFIFDTDEDKESVRKYIEELLALASENL